MYCTLRGGIHHWTGASRAPSSLYRHCPDLNLRKAPRRGFYPPLFLHLSLPQQRISHWMIISEGCFGGSLGYRNHWWLAVCLCVCLSATFLRPLFELLIFSLYMFPSPIAIVRKRRDGHHTKITLVLSGLTHPSSFPWNSSLHVQTAIIEANVTYLLSHFFRASERASE